MPEGSLQECWGEWGFPFQRRVSQNGASTCPSFSLRLQEREPGWLGLAFQTPGSGSSSVGVWFAGPNFMSLLDLGAPGSVGFRALASLSLSVSLST